MQPQGQTPIPIPNAPFYASGYSGHVPRPMRQGVGGGVGGTYQPLSQQASAPLPQNQQTPTMFNNMNNAAAQQQQQPTSYVPQQQHQTPMEHQNMNVMLDQYLQQFQEQYGPFSNSNSLQPMKVTTTNQLSPQQQQYNSFQPSPQAPIPNDQQQQPMGAFGNQQYSPQFQQPQTSSVASEQQSEPMASQNRNQSDPTNFGFFGVHDMRPQEQPQMFYSQMPSGNLTESPQQAPAPQCASGPANQEQHFYPASQIQDQNGNAPQAPAQMVQPPPEVAQQIQEAVIAHIQQQLQQQGAQTNLKPMPSFRQKTNNTAKKSTSKSMQPMKQSSPGTGVVQNFPKQQRNPMQKRSVEAPRRTTASIYGSPLPISASYSGHIPGVKLNTYGVTFGQAVNSTSQYRDKYIHKKK